MPKFNHIVLLKFKPEVTQETIDEIFKLVEELKDKIPGMLDYSGGPYSSDEGINEGYTHGLVMTFADAESRDAYLPHPAHEVVKEAIIPTIEGLLAFDYEF